MIYQPGKLFFTVPTLEYLFWLSNEQPMIYQPGKLFVEFQCWIIIGFTNWFSNVGRCNTFSNIGISIVFSNDFPMIYQFGILKIDIPMLEKHWKTILEGCGGGL